MVKLLDVVDRADSISQGCKANESSCNFIQPTLGTPRFKYDLKKTLGAEIVWQHLDHHFLGQQVNGLDLFNFAPYSLTTF